MTSHKRRKLLACARSLFETEGFHATGIDRILAQAGVAKMTLYNNFGSKDQLIVAVLEESSSELIERLKDAIAGLDDPCDQILGIFEQLAEMYDEPSFSGCMFQAAVAEFPDRDSGPARAAREHLERLTALFEEFCRRAELPEPGALGSMFAMLASGANCAARQIQDRTPAEQARQIAELVLERACSRSFPLAGVLAEAETTRAIPEIME